MQTGAEQATGTVLILNMVQYCPISTGILKKAKHRFNCQTITKCFERTVAFISFTVLLSLRLFLKL